MARRCFSLTSGVAGVLVGLLILLADGIALTVTFGLFLNAGPRVTVPASAGIRLEPGVRHAVYHELTGSHATINRPVAELPDTLRVTLTDGATGAPIAASETDWHLQLAWFGLKDRRRAVREFTAPDSGLVDLDVTGLDAEQVFYIGPTPSVYTARTWPWIVGVAIAALILLLFGAACLLIEVTRRSRISLSQLGETPG